MAKTIIPAIRPATNNDRQAILDLVAGVLQEYGLKTDPCTNDSDLADIEASYHRRGGIFDVLEDRQGAVVGSVGLYPLDSKSCELRKMYVRKELRGRGLGKRLLEHALSNARRLGFSRVTLETSARLKEARQLYSRYGFQPFAAQHLAKRCDEAFELDLEDRAGAKQSGQAGA